MAYNKNAITEQFLDKVMRKRLNNRTGNGVNRPYYKVKRRTIWKKVIEE